MVERTESLQWRPFVMDFGVAHDTTSNQGLTQTGTLLGTPQYMSPEQARGDIKSIDRRSDVYSLGAMLYELLSGEPPFEAESLADLLVQVLDREPIPLSRRNPNLPADLQTITQKCLNKAPAERYESARALAEDLRRYLDDQPILAQRMGILRRIYRQARRQKLLFSLAAALLFTTLGLFTYGIQVRLEARERERQAQRQAVLAQHLGQEIKDMEWLLRSSRQLRIHNLEGEKAIIRKRMHKIQAELLGYGELSRGLAHYALGRGHLALHEYRQAFDELKRAMENGYQDAEAHYALGFVLGKHFEQAIYEARLAGGGDWAKKQQKELEAKYLQPALSSLMRSRSLKLDAPQYLEGLIAYYQRDYETALRQADEALREAPWLYEAAKLAGDVHLERALSARDSGHYEEAEREFAAAVKSYEKAAAEGQSDGEVYEGLAEAWVRQIEMDLNRGKAVDKAYAAAVLASDKLHTVEPQSIAGPLKKSFAAMMTMATTGGGLSSAERVAQCLHAADTVLRTQPGHPYASDAAANCHIMAAEGARGRGEDPEPLVRQAIALLEPSVIRYPHFLWGLNDLGLDYCFLGIYWQTHGNPSARQMLEKSLEKFAAAATLDPTYVFAINNSLSVLSNLIPEAKSDSELQRLLLRSEEWLSKCKALNSQHQQCFNNFFQVYARAAHRAWLAGQDPQASIKRAMENLTETRKLGGSLLDAEQHAALLHLVWARDLVQKRQDPGAALIELQTDLSRCFAIAKEDAMCRTLEAQAEWVQAEWLSRQQKPAAARLQAALAKATLATQSPEPYPDAWQTLAETLLRLVRTEEKQPRLRGLHLVQGLLAVDKLFTINPNHALGLATQGALLLERARTESAPPAQKMAARSAAQAFERALVLDPFLKHAYVESLKEAQGILQSVSD